MLPRGVRQRILRFARDALLLEDAAITFVDLIGPKEYELDDPGIPPQPDA